MSLRFKIVANTFVQLLGKAISAGITLTITILIAKTYGVSGYGEYTKIIAYIALFYLAVDFGLNAAVLGQMPSDKDPNPFSTLLATRLILAAFWIFVSLAVLSFLPFSQSEGTGFSMIVKLGIILFIPTIFMQGIFVTANAWFQKILRYDRSVLASSLGGLITTAVLFLLVSLDAPLLISLSAYLIGSTVMAIVALYLAREARFFSNWSFQKTWLLVKNALPLGLTLVFNLVFLRADTLILTLYRSTAEVGIYGFAYRFFELPLTLPTFFMNAVYPIMIKSSNSGTDALLGIVKKSSVVLLVLSIVGTIVGFIVAPMISLVDVSFADSIYVFRILVLSLPFFFLSSVFMWLLVALKRYWLLAFIYGFSMIINVALNIAFIPRFGYSAAAVITGATEAIVVLLTVFFGMHALRKNSLSPINEGKRHS